MSDRLHTNAIDNSDGTGVPVLFLHGFGGLGVQWWGHQTAISFKVPTLAFDLPGHGKSLNYPEAGPPIVAARAAVAELEARDINRVHIVGHSMGGAIASLIGLIAAEKIESLILLAPGGYGTEFNHPLLMQWAAAQTKEELAAVMPHFFGSQYQIPEKVYDFQLAARSQPGAVETLTRIGASMSSDGKQGVLPIDDVIAGGYPISVLWGEEDGVLPVSHAKSLKGRVDVHILKGVGHSPSEEAPDAVRSVILNQLKMDTEVQRLSS